uniref:Uncharacterized protein n=1 Tax=Trepomonas sp. PC1 TaxID=1076344 RepID=A0A146KGR3_9EUKA|eukprot:JAP95883.1 Hypothetical protein TPC1_10971 [Trepomonas sp. PC1]
MELDSKLAEKKVLQKLDELDGVQIQTINLSCNKIQTTDFISRMFRDGKFPQLRILLLNQNFITVVDLQNITTLLTLDVSQNPIKDFKLANTSSLKSLDAKEANITDQLFMKLLRETKARHLKLQQNKISNKGIDAVIKDQQLKKIINESLLSLDLKANPTELQSLLKIKNKYFSKEVKPLPQIGKPQSKPPSKPASRVQKANDINSLMNQMQTLQQEKNSSWPQALVGVLLGPDHILAKQAANYCNKGVCGALVMGIKCQPDIEEVCGQNFIRKCGTAYCKEIKVGNGLNCQQRCEAVLMTVQKMIDKQIEEK